MALRTAPACAWPDGQSVLLIGMKMPQDCASEKVNGSLPEKSKPLMKARYKPLAHEAKMPEARFSKAPAILNREFQLDI